VHVLVVGAAGMLGRKLVERLALDGVVGDDRVTRLTLVDAVQPATPAEAAFEVEAFAADLADAGVAARVVSADPDLVFQLAAVVSGEAESNFDKGYRVNVDGMRLLLEAIRERGDDYRPRLVFTSSVAVFGPPFPEIIGDDQCTTPRTSYGTEKAIGELLLSDYSRRGFVDGVALRLPTICVRPGSPNLAASGFFSNIIREPLNGLEAVLPVPDDVRHWFASPRAAVAFLLHAATLAPEALVERRSLTMPGVSATVAEEIAALHSIAGSEATQLIRRRPDPTIMRIVAGWPRAFDTRAANELGFRAESTFEEIVRVYVEDDLRRAGAAVRT
jgi:nucleoside-diphosphate-sugar epimerase